MKSSLGFHTLTISLDIKEAYSLLQDFLSYSKKEQKIIMEHTHRMGKKKLKSTFCINEDGTFYLPLETEVYYRKDIGIRWRIVQQLRSNLYIVHATINPKLLSGINEYLTAATYSDLKITIENFNLEAAKISPLLKDFYSYHITRIDYCVNFALNELAPYCSSEQMISLIKRANIPPFYYERMVYDEASHRKKSEPGSFYLISKSCRINIYSKWMQLVDQSRKNIERGYPPVPKDTVDKARDVIRFEVQCYYHKTYNLSKKADGTIISQCEKLLCYEECVDQIERYFKKIITLGDWYTLKSAEQIIRSYNFYSQKEQRLLNALHVVNRCRSVAKVKEELQGDNLKQFRTSLKELSDLGINPVTIPKEWGLQHIPNLLCAYFDRINDERIKERDKIFL